MSLQRKESDKCFSVELRNFEGKSTRKCHVHCEHSPFAARPPRCEGRWICICTHASSHFNRFSHNHNKQITIFQTYHPECIHCFESSSSFPSKNLKKIFYSKSRKIKKMNNILLFFFFFSCANAIVVAVAVVFVYCCPCCCCHICLCVSVCVLIG